MTNDDDIKISEERALEIFQAFTELFDNVDFEKFYDAKLLPYPKADIYRALKMVYVAAKEHPERDHIKAIAKGVGSFQAHVGLEPFTLPIDERDLEAVSQTSKTDGYSDEIKGAAAVWMVYAHRASQEFAEFEEQLLHLSQRLYEKTPQAQSAYENNQKIQPSQSENHKKSEPTETAANEKILLIFACLGALFLLLLFLKH